MYWSCAQVENQRESVAERHLRLAGFETYIPRVKVMRRATRANGHASPVSLIVPLFPSYAFVRVVERWHAINSTIGVVRVLTDGEGPARVSDAVMMDLHKREGPDGLVVLPSRGGFQRGDAVRIISGPFRNHLALFEDMRPRERVEILLQLFGSERRLELPRRDILRVR